MSFVFAAPEEVQAAAQNLAGIRNSMAEASASAAAPTAGMAAAAEDEVSAGVAALFGSFGQEYQVISAQVQTFHEQFVNLLSAGAGAYLSTDAANAGQTLLNAVNGPVQGLVGEVGAAASNGGAALRAAAAQSPALLDPILGGGTVGGSLFGSLGGGSLGSGINGVVSALQSGSHLSLLSGTGLPNLLGGLPGLPTALQSLQTALLPGLSIPAASTGLASVAGPYQALFNHTVANLQTLGNAWLANPAPFLHQIINNQVGYAQTAATDFQYVLQNLPTVLANVPANIQIAIQALMDFDPGLYIQQFINQQIAYANIISTSLQNAAHDLATGMLLGINVTTTGGINLPPSPSNILATITPTGVIGDLLPILAIPGMAAQNFTNLLPAGSIPAQMSQNFTNVIKTLTDTSIAAQALLTWSVTILPPSVTPSLSLTNTIGLPMTLAIDAAGPPVNALNAFNASATGFTNAIQTGDPTAAIGALIDAPALITDGFLNGQTTLPLSFDLAGQTASLSLPLNGILVPQTPYTATVALPAPFGSLTVPVGGTPLSGLATGLLVYAPEQLALAITP